MNAENTNQDYQSMETPTGKIDEGFLSRYFNFRSLVSLWMVKLLYAIGLIVITVYSVIQLFSSFWSKDWVSIAGIS
jgi:hypothetical protein